jgi:hypothetical protein
MTDVDASLPSEATTATPAPRRKRGPALVQAAAVAAAAAASEPAQGPETPEQMKARWQKCYDEITESLQRHRCRLDAVARIVHEPVGADGAGLLTRAVAQVAIRPEPLA